MKQQLSFWKEDSTQAASRPTAQAYQKSPRKPLTIKELPESERPVNRLHHYGANALSTTELLASTTEVASADMRVFPRRRRPAVSTSR